MSKQLLVVLGMPGAGKDTQIEILQTRRDIEVFRTGDMVRERAQTDPEFEAAVQKGELADDSVVNDMVLSALKNNHQDLLISDGFPRDLVQAKWLDDTLKKMDYELLGALYLQITDDTGFQRLLKRGRTDDDEATIHHRIEVFHVQTDPVIDFYKQQDKLLLINGEQTVHEVSSDVQGILGW